MTEWENVQPTSEWLLINLSFSILKFKVPYIHFNVYLFFNIYFPICKLCSILSNCSFGYK